LPEDAKFPTTGLIRLLTIINTEKAPAPIERLQLNSFSRATKKNRKGIIDPIDEGEVTKLNQRPTKQSERDSSHP